MLSTDQMAQVERRLSLVLDLEIKCRANQISHTLPTTRHRCNLDVWALAQSRGDGQWVPLTRDIRDGIKRV